MGLEINKIKSIKYLAGASADIWERSGKILDTGIRRTKSSDLFCRDL